MSNKILVTGGAGFIGFHLCRRLLDAGWEVVTMDNVNSYYDPTLKESRLEILRQYPNFRFYRLDLANQPAVHDVIVEEQFNENNIAVHLAAQAGVRYALQDPHSYVNSNILGTFHLLDEFKEVGCKHFLYASSSSVYGGNTKLPFSVHDNVDHPISFYAASKKANELMAHVYSYTYGIPTTGLRFFTVYGPYGRPDMALFLFTKAIIEGKPIQVFNYGEMFRDFTYVDDIVSGIVSLLYKTPEANPNWDGMDPDPGTSFVPYKVFNIGNHQSVRLLDFIAIIEKSLGKKAIIELAPIQKGDVKATFADISDLTELSGYVPTTSVEQGIPKFVEWYLDYFKVKI